MREGSLAALEELVDVHVHLYRNTSTHEHLGGGGVKYALYSPAQSVVAYSSTGPFL